MKIQILTIALLPLIVCSCASHRPTQVKQRPIAPVPQTAPVVEDAKPQIDELSLKIKQLEAENSELRMQLLQNVLTH